MVLCHKCSNKEKVGAVYCSECGTLLIYEEGTQISAVIGSGSTTQDLASHEPSIPLDYPLDQEILVAGRAVNATLIMVATGGALRLAEGDEVTLGRVCEGQPIVPDFDLTPYKAYEAGVSRMHASIKIHTGVITITDLGSANGTCINGRQITTNIPYPLRNGDILTLGKLKIHLMIESITQDNGGENVL